MATTKERYQIMHTDSGRESDLDPSATGLLSHDVADIRGDTLLDVYDEDTNSTVGAQKSSVVHESGLLHKTAYCWVFDDDGRLLLTRMCSHGQAIEDRWSVSFVAHARSNETHEDAATRVLTSQGFKIDKVAAGTSQPLKPSGPMHIRKTTFPGGVVENELIQSFKFDGAKPRIPPFGGGHHGPEHAGRDDVFLSLQDVKNLVVQERHTFTDQFLQEIEYQNWFGNPK